jgi:hypothetical protein
MRPTYQSILRELILCDLDKVPYELPAHDWCRSHGLIESRLLEPGLDPTDARSYCVALTTTGQILLNQTSVYFQSMLRGLHKTGQLNPQKAPNGTQNNNDPQQQEHDCHISARQQKKGIEKAKRGTGFPTGQQGAIGDYRRRSHGKA